MWTQGDFLQTSERFPNDTGAVWEGDGCLKVDSEQWNSIRKPKLKLDLCLILFKPSTRFSERAVSWIAGLTLSVLKNLGALKGPLTLRPVSDASICAQDELEMRFQERTSFQHFILEAQYLSYHGPHKWASVWGGKASMFTPSEVESNEQGSETVWGWAFGYFKVSPFNSLN